LSRPLPLELRASAFPAGTPLNAFCAWNEARFERDRRHVVVSDIVWLLRRTGGDTEICLAHLAWQPLISRSFGRRRLVSETQLGAARGFVREFWELPAVAAARRLVESLSGSLGAEETGAHAAVFDAFEELSRYTDLKALARLRPAHKNPAERKREILVVKLGALGDFIQALGPMPDIRRHHPDGRITLLTTPRYAELALATGLFDDVIIDHRPTPFDVRGWLALRRTLRRRRFDRVYDFQTSDRTELYAWFFAPGQMPEWSGIAWRCSHPHANSARNRQHTMDRQAEQLLMAGLYPVSRVPWLPPAGSLPAELAGRRFAMLIPGSSPRHLVKRWPARCYAELAKRLSLAGYLPVLVGVAGEADLGGAIRDRCPEALDFIGRTDVAALAALARAASLTVGNDTGATHVAAAGGNPALVLFSRASDPTLCAPRGRIVQVLIEGDLRNLPVETVFAACAALETEVAG
jgi:ADP-heptose:LPS heptosyltransferase